MTDKPNSYLPNDERLRTTRQLIDELQAAVSANPCFADKPIGFAIDGTAYSVRGYDECISTGRIVLIHERLS